MPQLTECNFACRILVFFPPPPPLPRNNVNSSFGDLRDDNEFSDVTLAWEDGQQAEAHKVILAGSSPQTTIHIH